MRQRAALDAADVPLEFAINRMDGFLMGVVETLRALDRRALEGLRDDLADVVCNREDGSETDLMLFARLSTIEAELASAKAFDCAFERHRKEDIVLWSLLDAWNGGGRPDVSGVAWVQAHATDERTRIRLLSSEEQVAQAMKEAAQRSMKTPIDIE